MSFEKKLNVPKSTLHAIKKSKRNKTCKKQQPPKPMSTKAAGAFSGTTGSIWSSKLKITGIT